MKSLTFTLTLILISLFGLNAQTIDYDRIVLPEDAQDITIEERLVQLAWQNHPDNKILFRDKQAAKYNMRSTQWSWLEQINISGNLNEFTLDKDSERNNFYPRYNFSVSFPLGMFATRPLAVKQAREMYKITDDQIKSKMIQVRASVLSSYENYKTNKEIYEIEASATQDIEASFQLTEQRFKNGEESLENYSSTLRSFNDQKRKEINARNAYNLAKIELESLIGLKLEEVL
ncbi:TolC family protein [Fulvivirga sediminis]|uniref:TolC family protein n=1 Tax=Fulvivirga sediminis TaxID=2803949 RepID=A0A937K246_9BACT|nr:TolC family protein [Fulvivirga sediminis]MBL3658181.1 TolC family protein [Fulvivirga sediminis]